MKNPLCADVRRDWTEFTSTNQHYRFSWQTGNKVQKIVTDFLQCLALS